MFTIGGVSINPSMEWTDQFSSQVVEQTTRRTLTGKLVIYSASLQKGQKVTLVSTEEYGWLTRAQADALLALAEIPGVIYSMVRNGETYNVVFRHDEPPAIDLRPLIPRMSMESTDYLVGTIKLLIV